MEHASPEPNDCLLVVDDDDLDRRTIRRVLGRSYILLEAATGVQAEGLLQSRSIDCVLLDYHIPGTDTLAFLEMCVQARLPVIMLTGAGNEALAVEALKRGAQDYLTKDQMTQDTLERTVAHAIQHAMMQRLLRNKQRELQDRQKQIEHERNFMSSVLQSQQDAVFVVDRNATILQNSTAAEALLAADSAPQQLTVRVRAEEGEQVVLEVADNGVGIEAANLTRIFQHGFTTKADGHGFGLHSSALMAQELGGTLTAHSAGVGQGAVFRLAFPMQEARACRQKSADRLRVASPVASDA